MNITKYALTGCGLVAGAYCVPAAFQSGLAIGVGLNGIIIGLVMTSVVIGSWLLGPLALGRFRDRAWWQGGVLSAAWACAFAVVLVNSVGFTAVNREKTVGTEAAKLDAYQTAQADKARLTDELTKLQSNEHWRKTNSCTDTLGSDRVSARTFCKEVQRLRNGIEVAQRSMAGGRPLVGDAQAETLASITGLSTAAVAKALPMWITVGMEVAANGFLFAAQAVSVTPRAPRKKSKRKSKRSKAGARPPVRKLVRSERFPNVYYDESVLDRPVADFRHEKALRAIAGGRAKR